jgi:hypothetical protein
VDFASQSSAPIAHDNVGKLAAPYKPAHGLLAAVNLLGRLSQIQQQQRIVAYINGRTLCPHLASPDHA